MSINSYLNDYSSNLILSESEKSSISTSIQTLETRLDSYFENSILEKFKFGSYTRGTILPRKIDEKSDVDYMVVFENPDNLRPQTFLDRLKHFAEAKYSSSEIHQSSPTIVLSLNNIKFELVPAYKSCETYYIPDGQGGWQPTYPNDFNTALTQTNADNNFIIKPIIRLIKLWNIYKNNRNFKSFEIEERLASTMKYCYYFHSTYTEYAAVALDNLKSIAQDYSTIEKLNFALNQIKLAQEYEDTGMPTSALIEIKKVFPEL